MAPPAILPSARDACELRAEHTAPKLVSYLPLTGSSSLGTFDYRSPNRPLAPSSVLVAATPVRLIGVFGPSRKSRSQFARGIARRPGDVRSRPTECNLGLVSTAQVGVLARLSKSICDEP